MDNRTSAISTPPADDLTDADLQIERLARETDAPVELVQDIYASERARLEGTARIKTYVPLLIHRNVKARLRARKLSRGGVSFY